MKNNKLKLIFVLPKISVGGAEKLILNLAKNINQKKLEIKIICLWDNQRELVIWEKELKNLNIPIKIIAKDFLNRSTKLIYPWIFLKLVKYFLKERPNIVQTQLYSADILGIIAAKITGVKKIISLETNAHESYFGFKMLLKKIANKLTTNILAVSIASQKYLIEIEKIPAEKIKVIYPGVELKINKLKSKKLNKKIIIGAMGRLTTQKGFDFLIKAMAKIKDQNITCQIAGARDFHDNQSQALKKLIKDLGAEQKVKIIGPQDPRKFFNEINILIMPSRWEGLPLTLISAGEAALPVVAARVGGIPEIIENEKGGLLFPAGDIDTMIEKINYLINNPKKAKSFGQNLQQLVLAKFDIKSITKQYEEFYENF